MDRLISEKKAIEAINDYWGEMETPTIDCYINAIKAIPSAEPCEDTISRKSIKHKLQEHHDFFVNAYGGFSNLPQNDKSRVDEILNCIAMVVNEPSVNTQEKTGHWIYKMLKGQFCSICDEPSVWKFNYCPNCGARMVEIQEGTNE